MTPLLMQFQREIKTNFMFVLNIYKGYVGKGQTLLEMVPEKGFAFQIRQT